MEELGGPPTPAVGFGAGIERLLLIMEAQNVAAPPAPAMVYVATTDDRARAAAARVLRDLRAAGLNADADYNGRSLKAQMKEANRLGSSAVIILASEEVDAGAATVRDMATGEQRQVPLGDLVEALCAKESGI